MPSSHLLSGLSIPTSSKHIEEYVLHIYVQLRTVLSISYDPLLTKYNLLYVHRRFYSGHSDTQIDFDLLQTALV